MKSYIFRFSRFILACFILFSVGVNAQTPEQARKITASYNKSYLENLAAESLEKSAREKKEAVEYANARNIPISYTTEEGAFLSLQKVLSDGTLIYNTTFNIDAAKSTRTDHLNIGGSTGFNLEGQNMTAHVWDGGHPLLTHQEYAGPGGNNRIIVMDLPSQLHYHAAHVIGTIAASGVNPDVKGMAPRSSIHSYDWDYDLSEATTAASAGMLLSNHSYGTYAEYISDNSYFGSYRQTSRDWDNLMFNAPYYLMVAAAGNDGNKTYYNSQPLANGYDMLTFRQTAKNNLVVAAAQDAIVNGNGDIISVDIASFSSPGPTDDLRIKPDITGNGVGVYSTMETSNTAYAPLSGTSMSSPNVTGSLLLLQEHYNNINNTFMRAATLKGLALHTADDAGPVGPDAIWGWGLLNAKRAAETITQNGSEALIQEMTLTQGQTITMQVDSDGINDLIASISWTDRPGVINTQLNSPTPALVNDLDIRVSKDGTTYYPWRLTSATTNSNNGDNKVDPFERVEVENASGTYTIIITHKGNLVGGSQDFSLIVTGLQVQCVAATTPGNVSVNNISRITAVVSWTPVPGALYDLRYREQGAASWTSVTNIPTSNYEITGLTASTDYEVQVRSICDGGSSSAYSTGVNFTTLGLTYCDSSTTSIDYSQYISNVSLNTLNHNSSASTYSDFTNVSTELVGGEAYTIAITTTASSNYDSSYGVWIDYNGNGIFEQGERVFDFIGGANTIASGVFTVPTNVDSLATTMRVSMTFGTTIPGPCDELVYGEVEDYGINLKPPCAKPTDLTITNVTMSTANIAWTAGDNETSWKVSWGHPGYIPGDTNEVGSAIVTSESFQISGLTPHATYEFYVQANCDVGYLSSWIGPESFTTLADPSSVEIIDRLPDNTIGVISTKGDDGTGVYCADYFTLTDDMVLGDLTFYGFNTSQISIASFVTGFNVYIYTVSGSSPHSNPEIAGTGVLELVDVNPSLFTHTEDGAGASEFKINVTQANGDVPFTLPAGDYWISAFPSVLGDPTGNGRWNWYGSITSSPNIEPVLIDPFDLFNAGAINWSNIPLLINDVFPAFAWSMIGSEPGSPLSIACVPNAIRDTDLGACEYTVVESEFDATFTGVGTITNDFNGTSTLAGEVLSLGVTTVIWTISNGSGQTESCTMTITVEDNEAPVISCPSNQTVRIEEGEEYFVVPDYFATGEATAVDNCTDTVTNVTQNPIPGTELSEGVHTITLNATDDHGNTASCSFELTVDPTLGGISDAADYGTLSLYPNPTKDVLIVNNPNNIHLETISIFDITGRLVQSIELTGWNSEVSIDVSALSTATYMVVISGEGGEISKRMVKK